MLSACIEISLLDIMIDFNKIHYRIFDTGERSATADTQMTVVYGEDVPSYAMVKC